MTVYNIIQQNQKSKIIMKDIPEVGFMREKQILKVFPVSHSTWWIGVKSGKYPQPLKLSPKVTVWKAEDIRSLIESFK